MKMMMKMKRMVASAESQRDSAVPSASIQWRQGWPEAAIVLVALALRLCWLELKPPHFDEGVNGYWVDQMTREGSYHYDPTNFHGPLHFYILFVMQTLFGRHVWVLRLPTVIFSTLCVVVALGYRRYLGRVTCGVAAAALALSPAMTFYGRYAIHESFLLLALMVTTWGIIGLWREGGARALWATALGISAMVLTKETYVIHLTALLLAGLTLYLLEQFSRSNHEPLARQSWTEQDLKPALAVSLGAIIFFYSGAFMRWSDLPGLWTTFTAWKETGTSETGGHVKPWDYWLSGRSTPLPDHLGLLEGVQAWLHLVWQAPGLLWRYEWLALAGLALSPLVALPGTSRTLRYLAISAGGTLAAYSIIRYKTPWCIIVIIWPFFFVLGAAIEQAVKRVGAGAAGMVAAVLLGHSAAWSWLLNFVRDTDENEPYVYVQTMRGIEKVTRPLRAAVAADRTKLDLHGVVLLELEGDGHPLPWLLGDLPHIDYFHERSPASEVMDADFLLVQDSFVSDIEDRLKHRYFRERVTLRGSSGLNCELYFDAVKFAPFFLGREPEFQPLPAKDTPLPKITVPPPEPP